MLVGLRTKVDAVMIGAGTMRAERYGRVVPDPEKRARRERDGLPHDPLLVIVSGRLDLPWDAPLFTDGGGRVLIFTASETEAPETETPVRIVRHQGARRPRRRARASADRARRPRPAVRGRAAAARPADRRRAWSTSCSSPTRRSSPGARGRPWRRACPSSSDPSSSPGSSSRTGELFARYRRASRLRRRVLRRRGSGRRPRPAPRRGAACAAPRIVPPSVAASPQLSWTLSTPSGVQ